MDIYCIYKYGDPEELETDVARCILVLESWENYIEGTRDGAILEAHILRLKRGLRFLGELSLLLSSGKDVANMVADVKKKLISEEKNGRLNITILNDTCAVLRENMRSLMNEPGSHASVGLSQWELTPNTDFRKINDLIRENIRRVVMTSSNWNDEHGAHVLIKADVLWKILTCLKPLFVCVSPKSLSNTSLIYSNLIRSLDLVLRGATRVTYLALISKMDEMMPLLSSLRNQFPILYGKPDSIKDFYRQAILGISSDETPFYILNNVLEILESNCDSFNQANYMLYEELRDLRSFVTNEKEHARLNNFVGVIAATEAICFQAIPILYSCYADDTKIDEVMDKELNDAIVDIDERIKHIKSVDNSQEIKLYDYPKVDGLGFLESFSTHLMELQEDQRISLLRTTVTELYTTISWLIHFVKRSPQEKLINEEVWTHVIRLAYQAEYVIDLFLVCPSDSRYIPTLSIIVKQVKELKEKVHALSNKTSPVQNAIVATSSHVVGTIPQANNHLLVGVEEEITAINDDLLTGDKDLSCISIVGMAGIGKTTLAIHLYESSQISGHFDSKAWCTVPQDYREKDLLLQILNQLSPLDNDTKELDDQDLADKICRCLKKHRYLVVIDDMWGISVWNFLKRCFPNDEQGSRILITTRYGYVALETNAKVHELRTLTSDESWELLSRRLLPQKEILPDNLLSIAKSVAEICRGLPLSIAVIAGLLLNAEKTVEMWSQISANLNSNILRDGDDGCKRILELSYNHLSDPLRSCFLYLGAFPEDQEISVICLARLWVAEGLVRGTDSESAEDVAERYIENLFRRSLVIPFKLKAGGGVKTLRLHDLLRDFCLDRAKEEHFLTMLDNRRLFELTIGPRRISIARDMVKCVPLVTWQSVRAIMIFGDSEISEIERILNSEHMVLLSVLHVHGTVFHPSCLSFLVHLRYLSIQVARSDEGLIRSVITTLRNLQVLILSFSEYAFEVPDSIWYMVKLRHVDILPSAFFPHDFSSDLQDSSVLFESLLSLSKLHICHGNSKWLSKLPKLQKLSCIFFHSWDDLLGEYRFPELNHCIHLTSLTVELGVELDTMKSCKLQLPKTLRKLRLSKFKMESDELSSIGISLPDLEALKLTDCIDIWEVDDKDFKSLKFLKIVGTDFVKWNASEDSFPCLQNLWLESCHSLEDIPDSFAELPKLRLLSVRYCNQWVDASAMEIGRIQHDDYQNNELEVSIYPRLQNVDLDVYNAKDRGSASAILCAGCDGKISEQFVTCITSLWHPECFRCHDCHHPISRTEMIVLERSILGNFPYHKACHAEYHTPKCDVCKHLILVSSTTQPFWSQRYCSSHEHDGTSRCCSCERLESCDDTPYVGLGDGRKLCSECRFSAIMSTAECQPLYLEIQDFFEGLSIRMKHEIPVLLVEATDGNQNVMPAKWILEEGTMSFVNFFTRRRTTRRYIKVSAIQVLYGLPRLLTGSLLVFLRMRAWLLHEGYLNLTEEAEAGICQVLSHMWLASQLGSLSASNVESTSSSSSHFTSWRAQKKLWEFFKHQIENDESPAYGKGFRSAYLRVQRYGLKKTLDDLRITGSFSVIKRRIHIGPCGLFLLSYFSFSIFSLVVLGIYKQIKKK